MESTNLSPKLVTLNEKSYTWEQFVEAKKKAEQKKGVQVVEVRPNVYKTRIDG